MKPAVQQLTTIRIDQAYKFCPVCTGKFAVKTMPGDEHPRLVCIQCGYIHYSNPNPTVLAIIQKNDQLLLVKRKHEPFAGYWDLPGGFVESGQTLETALAAELKEELGAKITKSEYFASFDSDYPSRYMIRSIVGIVFKVETKNKNFEAKSDTSAVKFFSKNNLPAIAPLKDIQATIKKLLAEKS